MSLSTENSNGSDGTKYLNVHAGNASLNETPLSRHQRKIDAHFELLAMATTPPPKGRLR